MNNWNYKITGTLKTNCLTLIIIFENIFFCNAEFYHRWEHTNAFAKTTI